MTMQDIQLKFYQAYMALNDVDAAVESFKNALEIEPNDGMQHCHCTSVHLLQLI